MQPRAPHGFEALLRQQVARQSCQQIQVDIAAVCAYMASYAAAVGLDIKRALRIAVESGAACFGGT